MSLLRTIRPALIIGAVIVIGLILAFLLSVPPDGPPLGVEAPR